MLTVVRRFGFAGEGGTAVFESFEAVESEVAQLSTVEDIMRVLRPALQNSGWHCAQGQRSRGGVPLGTATDVPVRSDGFQPKLGAALWVETGRSWTNMAFLQHAIEAALLPTVSEVVIAVVKHYRGQPTFDRCGDFLDWIWRSERLNLPYESLTLIGF